MIIVSDRVGLMGNQIWAYANMVALAKECNSRLIIMLTKDYYDSLKIKGNKITVLVDGSRAARFITWLKLFIKYHKTFLPASLISDFTNENEFKNKFKKFHLYFIDSWEQRCNTGFFIKNHSLIRETFKPAELIKRNVEKSINFLRKENKIIIAVHLRRAEDYKTWVGGKYYFNDNVYIGFIKQCLAIFKEALFYLFSDRPIDTSNYRDINYHHNKNASVMHDLYAMSLCDYILGPVSTFSMWASFWGNKPLLHIQDKYDCINIKNFSPIIAQDLFKNKVCIDQII